MGVRRELGPPRDVEGDAPRQPRTSTAAAAEVGRTSGNEDLVSAATHARPELLPAGLPELSPHHRQLLALLVHLGDDDGWIEDEVWRADGPRLWCARWPGVPWWPLLVDLDRERVVHRFLPYGVALVDFHPQELW